MKLQTNISIAILLSLNLAGLLQHPWHVECVKKEAGSLESLLGTRLDWTLVKIKTPVFFM
ncbi:hypothetical protein E2C01_091940 [Portunus trituberculatus]|uniref:Uncharacterized protein n=1 Tax=Portunus trituberculatus TaxID=210409 RepID=A0A5B7JPB7_PORTR|nr:hypothetical protein [Portunus trituberculatus]